MKMMSQFAFSSAIIAAGSLIAACSMTPTTPVHPMTFFVTSVNPGQGANFGGLAGADAYCTTLAAKAGSTGHTWHAYLSTTATATSPAVNARDRIGTGPWQNAKGVVIANNVDELHTANKLNKQNSLTETGTIISGRGDPVNLHDILTGSTVDGRAFTDAKTDTTCGNWTKSGEGSAMVGHHDKTGLDEEPPAKSWNSSHATRGCSLETLKPTGGNGLIYCFAAK